MKHILFFFSDEKVHISALNAGIWLSALGWSVKILLGLPSAIYLSLKIYHEFIKPLKNINHAENHTD